MKRLSLVYLLFLILLSLPQAIAHPADAVEINFDSTYTLTINIHHPVKKFPSDHYINQVTVKLNDKEIIKQVFKSQTDKDWQNIFYKVIDAKPNDKITLTAFCSLFGKTTEMFIIPTRKTEGEK
ncbi:MAG: hypothetical protein ABIK67_05895 [candidate division WOR-3 bacterium]